MATRMGTDDLLKLTNFNRQELEVLIRRFSDLVAPQIDKIDRSRFRDLLADTFGVDDSLIMDRVFRCFDLDADNYISFDEYMKGMSIFLKGRWEEKLKFCFRVYDLNGDRYISKEEMFQMLKNCLVKGTEEDEDGVKDLVDLVLKKLDEDRDGRVSETDWNGAIVKENLLLEAFGQCLPTAKMVEIYLNPNPDDLPTGSMGKAGLIGRVEIPARPNALGMGSSNIASVGHGSGGQLGASGNSGAHSTSKHVHPHAGHGPKKPAVAPAAGVSIQVEKTKENTTGGAPKPAAVSNKKPVKAGA
ncbi:EF-hand calcium-binding domain-containing protein 1 [Phlyctochytrium planicorne]|nr:EF-hand calcium-binding domain-containing protein 1 [Phlyctochytrium planicorne]